MTRRQRLLIALAAALIGVALGWVIQDLLGDRSRAVLPRPAVGGPFVALDHHGRVVDDKQFRGKAMILSFGFTSCPDICPLGLARIEETLDALGPDASHVQALFITVDPARDMPERLKTHITHFSDRILGITGSLAQITTIAQAYRVYFKIQGDPATNPNYLVDHSGFIYVMDRGGGFVGTFNHDTPVENTVKLVRRAL
jgi:protein SCO1/2